VNKPTHVLFLIDRFSGRIAGGAENTLMNIIRLLPPDRYRSSLVILFDSRSQLMNSELPTCPVHFLPLRRSYDWTAIRMAVKLRRLIRSEQVGIVHTFFETSDIWGGLVARVSGSPVIISSRRDLGIQRATKHDLAYRLVNPCFDRIVAVSEAVRKFCIDKDHVIPAKVVTLHSGIATEQIDAAHHVNGLRESLRLQDATHVIATVAHVRHVKGIDVLIRSAAIVCREFPRALFLIVGGILEPQYFQQLQCLCESLQIGQNVRFVGLSDDVFSLLKICNLFCLPSRSEGFSNALLEAMACGLPCVATQVGGNIEALEEGGGFLVANEDWVAISDRILFLLRNPERAHQMAQVGQQIVAAKFNVQSMVNNLVTLYDDLLNAKCSPLN
jgi:glycosyltransferase involved in cell wall biosynthesis